MVRVSEYISNGTGKKFDREAEERITSMLRNTVGAALLALSLVLAACGGQMAAPSPAAEVVPTPPAVQIGTSYKDAAEPCPTCTGGMPAEDLTATPKLGGVVRTMGSGISRFDPCCSRNVNPERVVATLWGNGLVRWDLKCNCPAPDLAESWEVSSDLLTYTFKLRAGVKFHNRPPVNGRALTAEDVRWSIARNSGFQLDSKQIAQMGSFFKTLKDIQVVDPSTVRIVLKSPDVNLLRNLMYEFMTVQAKEAAIDGDFEKLESLIGTGPFMPTIITNVGLNTFVKNPDYWEKGKPYLDGVNYLTGADAATNIAAYQSKQLDWLTVGYPAVRPLLGSAERRYYSSRNVVGAGGWFMNMTIPPFDNLKVRQAFNLAVDREQLIAATGGPEAQYYFGFLGAWQPWHWSEQKWDTMPGYAKGAAKEAEREQARKLLAEAGFPNGLSFTCECSSAATDELMLQQVKAVGFNVTIRRVADNVQETAAYMKDKQMGSTAKGAGHVPDFAFVGQFLCGSGSNMSSVCDEQLQKLYEQEIAEPDEKKRVALFEQIQQRLFDLMPVAPGIRGVTIQTTYKYVRNWRNGFYQSLSNGWDVANWWLDK